MLTLTRAALCFSPKNLEQEHPLQPRWQEGPRDVCGSVPQGAGGFGGPMTDLPTSPCWGTVFAVVLAVSGEVTGSHGGAMGGFLQLSLGPSLLGGKLFFIYCSLGKLCCC